MREKGRYEVIAVFSFTLWESKKAIDRLRGA